MSPNNLVDVLVQRLELMYEVALWKWVHKVAVWQPAQEQSTLNKQIQRAQKLGLDPKWVKSVLQAQMDAAKVLQWSLIDGWRTQGPPVNMTCTDLVTEIRPRLEALTSEIIEELKRCVKRRHTPEFMASIHSHLRRLCTKHQEPALVWKLSLGELLK